MAHPLIWPRKHFYYPVGNTAPICLTQDIPPEQSANLLLLGCGDPRSILFTIYASGLDNYEVSRTLDFTCCDHEPAVLARNTLLFTLLADGEADIKGAIWNIFYDFYINADTSSVLIKQCRKLIKLSTTTESWRKSTYGSYLVMCTAHTLREISRFWKLWADFEELPTAKKAEIKGRFTQGRIDASTKYKNTASSARSAGPLLTTAITMILEEFNRFWDTGLTDPNVESSTVTFLNPTFAYSLSNEAFPPHYGTFPMGAFHLAQGFVLSEGSEKGINTSPKSLFAMAQVQLIDWGTAFQRCVATVPKVAIRFNAGDAIAFCTALHRSLDPSFETSTIYVKPWTAIPLTLEDQEYAFGNPTFDVIDTSNLADHLGPVNVLISTRPLLCRSPSSVLYTETLLAAGSDPTVAFSEQLCGDVDTVSLVLDLAPITHGSKITTHSNVHELIMQQMVKKATVSQFHERITWKIPSLLAPLIDNGRFISVSPPLSFDSSQLGLYLYNVYLKMFANENAKSIMGALSLRGKAGAENILRQSTIVHYSRESFALFSRIVQGRITPKEWEEAMEVFIDAVESDRQLLIGVNGYQDMLCRFHSHGIYTPDLLKPHNPVQRALPTKKPFHRWNTVPSCIWIVLQVPRSKLEPLESMSPDSIGSPILQCEVRLGTQGHNSFSCIHAAFGFASKGGTDNWPSIILNEDTFGWTGTSSLLVWFRAPAWPLALNPETTRITLAIKSSPATFKLTSVLGMDMVIYGARLDDISSVFVTPDQPLIGALRCPSSPKVALIGSKAVLEPQIQISLHQSSQSLMSFKRRFDVTDLMTIPILENPKTIVLVEPQRYPSSIPISVGGMRYFLDFPLPIDGARTKLRVARKSHYIEVITFPSTPKSPGGFFLQNFPLVKHNKKLALWNMHRLNLDRLPSLEITHDGRYDWLKPHVFLMMSQRERRSMEMRKETLAQNTHETLWQLKESLAAIFMRVTGLQGKGRHPAIGLHAGGGIGNWTLLFFTAIRLDLSGNTITLDGYVVPLNDYVVNRLKNSLQNLKSSLLSIRTSEREIRLWKELLPAATERCRQTWTHGKDCEYFRDGGHIPLSYDVDKIPICACGVGKDVHGLRRKKEWEKFAPYATRVAISPLFAISYLERIVDFSALKNASNQAKVPAVSNLTPAAPPDSCNACGQVDVKLFVCSKCKTTKYCSAVCQRGDWKNHRSTCH